MSKPGIPVVSTLAAAPERGRRESYEKAFKRGINAPCVFIYRGEGKGKGEMYYPAVNCGYGCDACGWNPEEKLRRLKTGRWQKVKSSISPVTGKEVTLPAGVKQLRFRQNRE